MYLIISTKYLLYVLNGFFLRLRIKVFDEQLTRDSFEDTLAGFCDRSCDTMSFSNSLNSYERHLIHEVDQQCVYYNMFAN